MLSKGCWLPERAKGLKNPRQPANDRHCFCCFCFVFSRDFYEKLDRLKTPELDETLDPSREETERKHSLPLDLYKRQLNRVFSIYTKGRTINWDTCKARDATAKQVWFVEHG